MDDQNPIGNGDRQNWTAARGNTLWSQAFGGSGDEGFSDCIELTNRVHGFVGGAQSYGSGGLDVYLVQIGPDDSILPVELISFEAEAGDQQVYLSWRTASESQ